jgi:hypothetical protein
MVCCESVPYVAGWGETGEVDAGTAFAKTIDELAAGSRTCSVRRHAAEEAGLGSVP